MKTALVIGGGFAGCAATHQLQLMGGWDVTVVERAPFLGAGVRTRYYGGHPYTFGPRHFLTPWEHIYHFLNTYVPLRRCQDHQFLTYVEPDERFYSYPIHADDIREMPEAGQISEELSAINTSAVARLTSEQLAKMTRSEIRNLNNASLAKNFEEFWIYSIGQTLYGKFVDQYSG
jgi:UDP-galactopyranose mutase